MDEQVRTTICPNCGAATSDLINCSSCGSFWIQHAGMEDVQARISKAREYVNEGLEKTLEKYCSLLRTGSSHDFAFIIGNASWSAPITLIPNHLDLKARPTGKECSGFKAIIRTGIFSDWSLARFVNSTSFFVFRKEPCALGRFDEYDGFDRTIWYYVTDFGFDYKGATQLLTQVCEEVFDFDTKLSTYTIGLLDKQCFTDDIKRYWFNKEEFGDERRIDREQTVHYNSAGILIEATGDGMNLFRNLSTENNPVKIKEPETSRSYALQEAIRHFIDRTQKEKDPRLYLDILGANGEILVTLSYKPMPQFAYTITLLPGSKKLNVYNRLLESPLSELFSAHRGPSSSYFRDNKPSDFKLGTDRANGIYVRDIEYYWMRRNGRSDEIHDIVLSSLATLLGVNISTISFNEKKLKSEFGQSCSTFFRETLADQWPMWLGGIAFLVSIIMIIWSVLVSS